MRGVSYSAEFFRAVMLAGIGRTEAEVYVTNAIRQIVEVRRQIDAGEESAGKVIHAYEAAQKQVPR